MVLQKDQFPITIQAFELTGGKELFIAEQVVNNQQDVDAFSARYTGKIIKAKTVTTTQSGSHSGTSAATPPKRKSSAGTVFLFILFLLIILVAIGLYTGWIQRTFGFSL